MTNINFVPRVAAAIAYADLNGKRNGWKDAADLWYDLGDALRADYRKLARAAIEAMRADRADASSSP